MNSPRILLSLLWVTGNELPHHEPGTHTMHPKHPLEATFLPSYTLEEAAVVQPLPRALINRTEVPMRRR